MSGETTADLEDFIERLRRGESSARAALLERVYHRLRRIAAAELHRDFRRLEVHHDLDSVVDEAWAQLMKALETAQPSTVDNFYGLMFRKVRHVLFDMARRQSRDDARRYNDLPDQGSSGPILPYDRGDTTHEPSRLAFWTEFHREVENLPNDQRTIFDLHYFAELPQAEIARLLEMHPKQVSRLWIAATVGLVERLDGIENLL
jgi:RNA polymerase sigma factor (sigma-70 family)